MPDDAAARLSEEQALLIDALRRGVEMGQEEERMRFGELETTLEKSRNVQMELQGLIRQSEVHALVEILVAANVTTRAEYGTLRLSALLSMRTVIEATLSKRLGRRVEL